MKGSSVQERETQSAQTHLRQTAEAKTAALPALKTAAERAVSNILFGDHNLKRAGLGERFWQFREYDPGDRPQDIDWRQSAKTDNIFIRQREKQNSQSVFFWCARDAGMHFQSGSARRSKLETMQIFTLALSMLLSKAGEQIGTFGSFKTGRSAMAVDRIGHYVCHDSPESVSATPSQFKIPQNAYLFQIGDFLSPIEEIEKNFEHLAARTKNGCIIQILDPAELDLPYDGRIVFDDMRGAEDIRIENVANIRAQYQSRILAHNKDLQKHCTDQGWSYVQHRTDRELEETLADIWQIVSFHLQQSGEGQ